MSARPLVGPTRYDIQLGVMGVSLVSGAAVGVLSSVPLFLAGSLGALLAATVALLGTLAEFA
jgi:hypothetical protein